MKKIVALLLLLTAGVCSAEPADSSASLTRLFLQQVSYDSAIVKWRGAPDSVFFSGADVTEYSEVPAENMHGHKFARITGLEPDTQYYYSFKKEGPLASFQTAPEPGESPEDGNIHVWLLGDSGTATEQFFGNYTHPGEAAEVREGFIEYNREQADDEPLDLLLLLGDNAYLEGTDEQWQGAFFDIYPDILRSTATWPTIGNHEMGVGEPFDYCQFRKIPGCEAGPVLLNLGGTSESSDPDSYDGDGDGADPGGLPYLNIFTLPTEAEMGGAPSGTEQYYSFNYGNLHVISLDSQLTNRDEAKRAAMRDWLIKDLVANEMDWTIAIFHHPPFSKGENHDSDREQNEIDMREAFAPVFENYGVDVVFSGHAHSYERSWYMRDHYGMSDTFDTRRHALLDADGKAALGGSDSPFVRGSNQKSGRTIYIVAGAGGKADSLHPCAEGQIFGCTLPDWLMHPAHRTFDDTKDGYRKHGIARKGSIVLDVTERALTSRYIDELGQVLDEFVITR